MCSARTDLRPVEAGLWPALPSEEWSDTRATLHMWTQIVGKVRLARSPRINHWWQVPLYVTSRGLTTSPIPHDATTFQVDFDFIDHALRIATDRGAIKQIPLAPRSVADFHREVMSSLDALGVPVEIWTTPCEVENPVPFERDTVHAAYDPEYANRFWRILVQADRIFTEFRSRFLGKVSPVHFFWGSFDLAVTRFSGRTAPPHPGMPGVPDSITREAYSHEVSSCGFWPGAAPGSEPIFYSYAYPEPEGFPRHPVRPQAAFYNDTLREFVLPYEAVRTAGSPDETLLAFLQSSYEAAAELAHWDQEALERPREAPASRPSSGRPPTEAGR